MFQSNEKGTYSRKKSIRNQMELNRVIFPAPTPGYKKDTFSNLIWIPRSRYFSLKRFIKPLQTISFNESVQETRSNSTILQDTDVKDSKLPAIKPFFMIKY